MVYALNHPLRVEILEILNQQESSPSQLAGILDESLPKAAYHAKILHKCGCIELTRTKQKRGAVEHFYRALPESFIGHQLWRSVPRSLKGSVIMASLKSFTGELIAALKAGASDQGDTTLSAVTLSLDAAGRQEAATVMRDALSALEVLDKQSRKRAAPSGSSLRPFMGAVAFFTTASASAAEGR